MLTRGAATSLMAVEGRDESFDLMGTYECLFSATPEKTREFILIISC